jgi:hypothetical protein
VAVKEASANMDQIATILRDRPADFSVLAGDDTWTMPMLALGGDGVICTCANEIPAEMAAMCDAAFAGDWEQARLIHERWLPLMKANFVGGPNPVPVKAAMSMMGLLTDALRHAAPAARRTAPGASVARNVRPARPATSGRLESAERSADSLVRPPQRLTRERRGRSSRASWPTSTPGGFERLNPTSDSPDGWRVNSAVQQAILGLFAIARLGPGTWTEQCSSATASAADQGPPRLARGRRRAGRRKAVACRPGRHVGRGGVYLAPGVTVMPPSYINVGAWVGEGTMVDSHVLVGSCAQIGSRVHLSAGVQIGGVLEPPAGGR